MRRSRKCRNLLAGLILLTMPALMFAQGTVEFGFHYSGWSLNILKGWIEDTLNEEMGTELKDSFLEDIRADYPGIQEESYTQNVAFDSSGSNFGFEMRWYPGGVNGSFSLGLAVEKTTMKIGLPEISSDLLFTNGAEFQALSSGEFIYKPLSFLLSLRWDIIPSSAIHPYITFGAGVAGIGDLKKAELTYSYEGTYSISGIPVESYSSTETKTVEEIDAERVQEGDDEILSEIPVVPFVMATLGLKAQVMDNIYLMGEAGLFNGIIFRGGLALRF